MKNWEDAELEIVETLSSSGMSDKDIVKELKRAGYKRSVRAVAAMKSRAGINARPCTRINPHKLKKAELLELMTKRCIHRHTYLEHPACWYAERNKEPKVGYLDIETSNLKANYGMVLTYAIKTKDKSEYYKGVIDRDHILKRKFDYYIVKQLVNDMLNYDVLIGYWSTGFDIPFIRTRALRHGIAFPAYGYVQHKDVYYMVKYKLCLNRNSLEAATRLLGIEGKNHVDGETWTMAATGDKKALSYVLDHNIRDVDILEELHSKLEEFVRPATKSI